MVHKRGRYQLLLGLLAVVALSPAEARVMADYEPVPQVIPVQNYWRWQPGTDGGTGQGRQQLCAQLQSERAELRAEMDQSGPRRRERLRAAGLGATRSIPETVRRPLTRN